MSDSGAAANRRAAIRDILSTRGATTQDALQKALRARGIRVAQATVSRDLVRLGAARVAGPDGTYYSIPHDASALPLDPIRGLVDAVLGSGNLVIVRTKAGAASTVARAIDDAAFKDALGSIAGDDTIFVATESARKTADLSGKIRRLFL